MKKVFMPWFTVGCSLFSAVIPAMAQPDFGDAILQAPDGSLVTVARDSFGVPHITGQTEVGIFFGQGFAVAQDRLYQLELHRKTAEGRLAELFGDFVLAMDKQTRTMFYTQEERKQQFAALPVELQTMLQAYSDGINTYLDSMAVDPAKYKPFEFSTRTMEPWSVYNSVAIIQFLIRTFGQFGGEELDRLSELQENGQAWFDQNRPINDPAAPTTIQNGSTATTRNWSYSGLRVNTPIVQSLRDSRQEVQNLALSLGVPTKFGSFAVLISTTKSNGGNAMLLGAPQMGEPQKDQVNITNEVELNCPTYGFHVGGMTVAGVPSVIIGTTEHHAWSLTSGLSDNSDVYIDSTMDASFSKYYHKGQWLDFQIIQDTLKSAGNEIPFTHYRTIHGPVFGEDLAHHQVYALRMTFWGRELELMQWNYNSIKATTLSEFEAALKLMPMSFNVFYAALDKKVKYWHVGKYQDRSDGVDPRLPHKGDGSEEWGGFLDFSQLPSADDLAQDYFVNWNNKPVAWWDNGDNVPWVGPQRVTAIDDFVAAIAAVTFDELKDVPRQINSHGTYQQAIAFTGLSLLGENILPPGQSGFKDLTGQLSRHFGDQWPLHLNWQFKKMGFDFTLVSVESDGEKPATFALHQNYPNPFNPVTTIAYELPRPARVLLAVYNLRGQQVRILLNEFQTAGTHRVPWDASSLSSGVYLYQIKAGSFSAVRKGVVLK
ncbi:MAG: penicillin acylase family protein [bacterium]